MVDVDTATPPVRQLRGRPAAFDAIIVGASFGGLAAAMELAGAGRILLVDRKPVGEGETSACGTLLRVLERLQALEALEQVHDEIALHFNNGAEYRFRPRYPFATFDYRTLCNLLLSRTDATFVQASVTGMQGDVVTTTAGEFSASIVMDASGWRAIVGASKTPGLVQADRSLGIEMRVPRRDEALHFWVLPPEMGCGAAWLFPAGSHSRVGIACYHGKGGLKPRLEAILSSASSADLHGGFFPSRLRDPVADRVFLVGDAAGQCIPLTGEGIRPALVYGQVAGRLVRRVIEGGPSLEEALGSYRATVRAQRRYYWFLHSLQRAALRASPRGLRLFARTFGGGVLSRAAHSKYWEMADPELLSPGRPRTRDGLLREIRGQEDAASFFGESSRPTAALTTGR